MTTIEANHPRHHVTVDGNQPNLELIPFVLSYDAAEVESIFSKINSFTHEYSDDNALDITIVSRMYTKFWTYQSINHKHHRNYLFSIKNAVSTITKASNIDRNVADVEGTLRSMFKGVDKSLRYPVILSALVENIELEATHCAQDQLFSQAVNRSKFVNIFDNDEVVRLTPKNLIKYYEYPEADAKALFKNMSSSGRRFFLQKLCAVKEQSSAHPITYFRGRDGEIKVCWDVPVELKSRFNFSLEEKKTSIVKQLDKQLPIKKLSLWKSMTREWFKNNKSSSWEYLSIDNQKRHIVNFIRHSYYGYSQAYKIDDRNAASVLHDLSFELIVRRIHRTFPYLSSECKRQLDEN
jgi:hypothetical protein